MSSDRVTELADAVENGVNLDVVQDLRDLADWLEAHPELPRALHGHLSFRYPLHDKQAREKLGTVAEALGDRATEDVEFGNVAIAGKFGLVRVLAQAKPDELGGIATVIEYPPILRAVDLPVTDEDLAAAAGLHGAVESDF